MQVAGTACFVCGRVVGAIPDAIGCGRCRTVAHRACGVDRTCPSCGGALIAGSVLHAGTWKSEPESAIGSGEPAEPPTGEVSGSLLVFVVWIGANAVFQIIPAIGLMLAAESEMVRLVAIASVGVGVYGGWCTRALAEPNPRAPVHVHAWFGLSAIVSLLLAAVTGSYYGAGKPLLGWAVSALYLAKSKRVAAVYRPAA